MKKDREEFINGLDDRMFSFLSDGDSVSPCVVFAVIFIDCMSISVNFGSPICC